MAPSNFLVAEEMASSDFLVGEEVDVRALLIARNIKQKDLAKKYYLHPSSLSRVLKRKQKTYYIRKAVAVELYISYESLWGEKEPELTLII